MKQNNVSLCLFVSLSVLAVFSFFFAIPNRIIVVLSLSSLVYTIARTIDTVLDLKDENVKAQIEAFNTIQNMNMDAAQMVFFKRYANYFTSSKAINIVKATEKVLECRWVRPRHARTGYSPSAAMRLLS